MSDTLDRENRRLEIQHRIDSQKNHAERNRLGQFATPPALAEEILKYAHSILPPNARVRFLDPAIGTGSFYSALLKVFPSSRIDEAVGYEIDSQYAAAATEVFAETSLKVKCGDFTMANAPTSDREKFNLIICNPPYSRHHHLGKEEKVRLRERVENSIGVTLSGLSGVYCHFLCLSHAWLPPDGIAGWLIPSEFMDVNYGWALKRYLLHCVTLLRIHRFDPSNVQFEDAYVSSAIVWFRNAPPPSEAQVEFSYGGRHTSPTIVRRIPLRELEATQKWTRYPETQENHVNIARYRLSDFFDVKRGLATGCNDFFVMTAKRGKERGLPREFLRPVLPPPRNLHVERIEADENGNPVLDEDLMLLDCHLSEQTVRTEYPSLWDYIQEGAEAGIQRRYLCAHRSPWYSQENRPPSPFLCSYMGRQVAKRKNPFRFVLNFSNASATNVWLMLYPKQGIAARLRNDRVLHESIWQGLNRIPNGDLLGHGRVYGGGLYKLEPKELGNGPADDIAELFGW